jgi:tRNA U34 2-thiouridine synthase MnmA/TrmU
LYMRNWSEAEEGYCSAPDDMEQIDRVCKHLNIPYDIVSERTVSCYDCRI